MDSTIPPTLDEVCSQAVKLPTAPSLMPRLISVLNDPDSSAEDVQEIIQVDPALTATTLRLANSAFFGGGQPVETVGRCHRRRFAQTGTHRRHPRIIGRSPCCAGFCSAAG